jgi:hypothetical protein
MRGKKRIALCVAAALVVLIGVLAVSIGPWIWGPDWHVYGDESRLTTSGQEQAAMKCAPMLSSVSVLDSFPAEIDVHLRGSAGRANRVARCLKHSSGIIDAGSVRSR